MAWLVCFGSVEAATLVHIENASIPTRCAENDNIYFKFSGAGISHFTVTARHPAYLPSIAHDETAPDFTTCDQTHDPSFPFKPLDVILFEDDRYRLVGHRFSSFWRPENVDFRVGNTVTTGLHLVQLLRKLDGEMIEILVLYPSDGYWRLKPLPPKGIADTAYGSSFLVGPISEDGRPYVSLSSIVFVRSDLSFRLIFPGGKGALRVIEASRKRTSVSIDLPPSSELAPWAALRSMFTTPAMADTAEAVVDTGKGPTTTSPVLDLTTTDAAAITFGRSVPSRHNTSAPDLEFRGFAR